jgi:hypothetical protein
MRILLISLFFILNQEAFSQWTFNSVDWKVKETFVQHWDSTSNSYSESKKFNNDCPTYLNVNMNEKNIKTYGRKYSVLSWKSDDDDIEAKLENDISTFTFKCTDDVTLKPLLVIFEYYALTETSKIYFQFEKNVIILHYLETLDTH